VNREGISECVESGRPEHTDADVVCILADR